MLKKYLVKIKNDNFFKDLFITFSGQIIVMLLSFVLNKIISNQYSVSDYGIYSILKRFASVITFIMLMSMGIAVPKYIAEAKAKKNKRLMESYMVSSLLTIIIMFVVITAVLIGLDSFWEKFIFNSSNNRNYMLVICLFSLGNCLVTYAFSFYRGINEFFKYNLINIVLQFIFIFATLFVKNSLWMIYCIWGIFTIFYGVIEIYIIFNKFNFSLKLRRHKLCTLQELIEYSLPRIPGEFVLFAYSLVPLMIVSYKFGATQVGYFSAALSINSLVTPLFSLVGTILLPLVSGSKYNNNEKEVNKKILILGYIYALVSIFGIVFVYIFGDFLLTLLFNSEYTKSIEIVKIMIISILPNAFYLLLRNPLDGKSKFPYNTICLTISFIIYIILLLFASTIKMCAFVTIVAYTILGLMSLFSWLYVIRKEENSL